MEISKKITFPGSSALYLGSFEEPSECPLCKHKIKPEELHCGTYKDEEGKEYLYLLYLCHHCYQVFTALHLCSKDVVMRTGEKVFESAMLYIGPSCFTPQEFDAAITMLSPQFVKIFNQALEAEAQGLDEIAGIGYRKAIEFLVKDYCIHLHPDEAEGIKAKFLGNCIKEYVDDHRIKTLAERTTWIGNDETHYTRKIEGRDISDMKKFIQAMVYFIGMVLITEDAETISHA